MKIAVVTGASSGIGREFVLALDREGKYDEIWAVARREEKLIALREECRTPVRPVRMDLSREDAADQPAQLRGDDVVRLPLLFCPVRMTASRISASFISADFPDYRDRIADRDVVAVFE